jgi:mono/diheme cytochrome c family protein
MKKGMKIALGGLGGHLLLGLSGLTFLWFKPPASAPLMTGEVSRSAERVARGEYLVHHVSDCVGCHSDRDWTKFSGPPVPGTLGQGGFTFDEKLGVPGTVTAQNITSHVETGIGGWTDGQVLRAFQGGVRRTGEALFPMMPYELFREMSEEDAHSVVAFLRTLPAIEKRNPPRDIRFPVSLFIKFAPKPPTGPKQTPREPLARGKYLTTIAGCIECHTPHDDKNQRIAGREFTGGWKMTGPWGTVVTPNLTPDENTYIGNATKEGFIGRFKAFADEKSLPAATTGNNTVMGWSAYAGMTEEDLGAIFDYLKSLPPVRTAEIPAIAKP